MFVFFVTSIKLQGHVVTIPFAVNFLNDVQIKAWAARFLGFKQLRVTSKSFSTTLTFKMLNKVRKAREALHGTIGPRGSSPAPEPARKKRKAQASEVKAVAESLLVEYSNVQLFEEARKCGVAVWPGGQKQIAFRIARFMLS